MLFKKQKGKNERLNAKLKSIQSNFENNYKDAAQISLKEYSEILEEEKSCGKLKETQFNYYKEQGESYKEKLKNFHH